MQVLAERKRIVRGFLQGINAFKRSDNSYTYKRTSAYTVMCNWDVGESGER